MVTSSQACSALSAVGHCEGLSSQVVAHGLSIKAFLDRWCLVKDSKCQKHVTWITQCHCGFAVFKDFLDQTLIIVMAMDIINDGDNILDWNEDRVHLWFTALGFPQYEYQIKGAFPQPRSNYCLQLTLCIIQNTTSPVMSYAC